LTPCLAGSLARHSVQPRIGIALHIDGLLERLEAAEFAPGSAPPAAELAASAERVLRAILTAKPRLAVAATATTDELTREREAAVAG